MEVAAYIAAILAAALVLLATGWWRVVLFPLRISARRMTVAHLGLRVAPEHVQRVDAVLNCFAGGFNAMLTGRTWTVWERYCAAREPLGRPFAQEGAAMGYTPRRLMQYAPADFERRIVGAHRGFCYLHYVGLGFWAGMRGYPAERLHRIVADLDPLHGRLCYDGYGFKHAFFDLANDENGLDPLDALGGYARRVAYQGVGRALLFYYMDRPEMLIERIKSMGDCATDTAAGVGLAAVFIFPDRLDVARGLVADLPAEWHDNVHLGMCFGLKARAINDPDWFAENLGRMEPDQRAAVVAAVDECDRVERLVRAEGGGDSYHRWREQVTRWMADHIRYPLAGVKLLETQKNRQPADVQRRTVS